MTLRFRGRIELQYRTISNAGTQVDTAYDYDAASNVTFMDQIERLRPAGECPLPVSVGRST